MPLVKKTRKEYADDLTAFLDARLPGVSVTTDTDLGARIKLMADALHGMKSEALTLEADLFPKTASDEALNKHAEARIGPNARKGATTSKGTDAVKVYGTAGSTFSVGDTLAHSNGKRYKLTTAGTIPSSAPFEKLASAESIDTGTKTNLTSGEKLTFETPPAGITAQADVVADIDGAVDSESDGALLARIEDRIVTPPAGGRASDYKIWATEVEGCDEAFVYVPHSADPDGRNGVGSVDVVIMKALASGDRDGNNRVPTAATKTAVENNIAAKRPAAVKSVTVYIPGATVTNFDIEVTTDSTSPYDFAKPSPVIAVSLWSASTRELTWDTALPADVAVGDRICCAGHVVIIEAISGVITTVKHDTDTTKQPFEGDDPTSQAIWPGGPHSRACINAVKDYMNKLGPAKGTAADPNQIEWDDTMRLAKVHEAILAVSGVVDVLILTPASNSAPSDAGPPSAPGFLYANIVEIAPPT